MSPVNDASSLLVSKDILTGPVRIFSKDFQNGKDEAGEASCEPSLLTGKDVLVRIRSVRIFSKDATPLHFPQVTLLLCAQLAADKAIMAQSAVNGRKVVGVRYPSRLSVIPRLEMAAMVYSVGGEGK